MGCISSKHRSQSDTDTSQWDGHIRPVAPWKTDQALSTEFLTRLRTEFWETRVEGRQEMWQAIRFAANSQSEQLCDETIKAAGLRSANRSHTLEALFDERGALYEIPMYALAHPINLDQKPVYPQFKHAAKAVADLVNSREKSLRPSRRT